MKKLLWLSMFGVISLLIAACSNTGDTPANTDNQSDDNQQVAQADDSGGEIQTVAEPSDISYDGMGVGDYELSITGALNSVDSYSGEMPPVEFERHPDGNNTVGPREFILLTDIQAGDVYEDTQARVYFKLPDGIQAGSYAIVPRHSDNEGQVQVQVDSGETFGFEFDDEISGTLTITEIGEFLTASFDFSAVGEQADNSLTVDVSGRAYQIPFDFRPQITANFSGLISDTYDFQSAMVAEEIDRHSYQFKFDDFTEEYNLNLVLANNDFSRFLEVDFWFVNGIQAGTNDVIVRQRDGSGRNIPEGTVIASNISIDDEASGIDFVADSITGTLTYSLNERGTLTGSFDVTGTHSETGETVTISGTFDHLPNIFEEQ